MDTLAIARSRQRAGGSGVISSSSRVNQSTADPSTPASSSARRTSGSTVPRSSPTTIARARAASSTSTRSIAPWS